MSGEVRGTTPRKKPCSDCAKAKEKHIKRHGRAYSFWVMCDKHADAFAGGLGEMASRKGHSA